MFKVRIVPGDGGAAEEVDLLNDHLVTVTRVVRENARGRVLDPDSVFDAIEQAYGRLRDELRAAPGVG